MARGQLKELKASNAQEAYEEVLARIRAGSISHDQRIVDVNLAAELNMSRMPAREALMRLTNEGYLVGTTRGFMLPVLSPADISEIFEIRRLLEPRAAASAVPRLSGEHLGRLRKAHGEAEAAVSANDPYALMKANTQFRDTWLDACPNKRLVSTISRFIDHVHFVRSSTLYDKDTRKISFEILTRILNGFSSGDALVVHDQIMFFVEEARVRFILLSSSSSAAR